MEWAEAIRAATGRVNGLPHLQALNPTLPEDLAAFVLEGSDPSVLGQVGFHHSAVLGVSEGHTGPDHVLRHLYDAFRDVPHDVLVRWGLVIDAAAGPYWHVLHVDHVSWPASMLAQVGMLYPYGELPFDFFDLAALLAAADVHSGRLVVHAWQRDRQRFARSSLPERTLARLRRYEQAVDQLRQWLAPLLTEGDVEQRVHALGMLTPVSDEVLATYAEQVVEAATCGSAQVRDAAAPVVPRLGPAGADRLRRTAVEAEPDRRRHALRLLWATATDDEQRTYARETALADRAASVRSLAEGFTEEPAAEAVPVPDVPTPEPVDWAVAWTPEVAAALTAYVAEARHWSAADHRTMGNVRYTPDEVLATMREQLTSPAPVMVASFHRNYLFTRSTSIRDAIEDRTLTTPAVVKLLVSGDLLSDGYAGYAALRWSANLLHHEQQLTLLDLWAYLDAVPGLHAVPVIATGWFHDETGALGRDWDPGAVWPFVAAHLDGVLAYWAERRTGHSHGFDSEALFPLVAAFPEPPTRLVELCYDLALGAAKSDRRAAQDFLGTHPDAVRRATAALGDGNGTVRAVAAGWLGRLGDREAVPALAAAFATERNETVQGELLDALVALGERLQDHFDLASVDAQAEKAMAKGLPAALRWLDPERLPGVRRAGGTGTVPRSTMLWLVARAAAAKSSEPGALLQACTAQLDADDAEAFADALLAQWVSADEESVGQLSRHQWNTPRPSPGRAAGARGVLALVAACGSARSVAEATRYVRSWHGQRAAQSKALVVMLAHHRDPSAAEALVAIAYRFKAPSIERTAREEVVALAERRGWTTDQLADRTVATAGFDENGALELSYGARGFTAHLLPDCGIALTDADGKPLTNLPSARQSDDAEAAKEAKKVLSAAKKSLAGTVQAQTARLHDAMCVQRVWSGAAWRQDLAGHPVLARLASRLVWVAEVRDRRVTFRLLDDGTLTDAGDLPVELADDAEVRIAHDVTLTDDEVEQWQQHLSDYEVPSLFWQLGRGRPGLTEEQAAAIRLEGRATLPSGRLGQLTTRLGYRRGAVGDAAAYDWFEKELAALGLTARITLEDGQVVGEHESETTVDGLVVEETGTGRAVPLGELPPVLLVELRHDLAVVTAA